MEIDTHECRGCKEYEALSRRGFLDIARYGLAAAVTAPAWLPRVALAGDGFSRDILVVIFLRGGIDGLTAVVPYGDPNYNQSLRPTLYIPPPQTKGGAIDLDGFFGLPPAMAPLMTAYQNGDLTFVHATGSPDPTRSHFDAFSFMEYGTPLQPLTLFTGWIGRHLQSVAPIADGPLRAVAISSILPKMLSGAPDTLPIADPAHFGFPGRPETADERRAVLEATYAGAGDPLAGAAVSTLDTIDLLETIDFENYTPANGAQYPENQGQQLGTGLRSAAALIKADVGVEAITLERNGWDTHNLQGVNPGGGMYNLMQELTLSLEAFHLDLQDRMNRLSLIVMSEFGRRADENGSGGTDHGHGNMMILMGGHMAGGQVHANWTNGELLHPDLQYQGDSLAVTTDYRDVVAEILANRLENKNLAGVFPNFTPNFTGVTVH